METGANLENREFLRHTDTSHKVYYELKSDVQTMTVVLFTFTGFVICSAGAYCVYFCYFMAKLLSKFTLVAS